MAISGCGASPTAIDLARTRPLGRGPAFRPPALGNRAVAVAAPVGTLRCAGRGGTRYGAHVELFALWGQPLSARRLGGFDAARGSAVLAFVDGRRWEGDPRSIPLRRHAQIVLEVGPRVEPHPAYAFPPGL